MRTLRSPLLVMALGSVGLALGQADAGSRGRVGSTYIGGGAFFTGEQPLFRQDLALLAPGSSLLAVDLSDHAFSNEAYTEGAGLFQAGIAVLPFRKADHPGPELRIGFLYAGRGYRHAILQRTERAPYDTLTSSQTGEQVFVDSVHTSTYWIDHSSERFGLDASLVWTTTGRWSVFGGAGFCGGALLNARTEVYHTRMDGVEGAPGPYVSPDHGRAYANSGTESFRNGDGWWLALYAPLGVDFRIARKGEFWSRMHLRYELRPQLAMEGLPELGSTTSFGSQMIFGARLEL